MEQNRYFNVEESLAGARVMYKLGRFTFYDLDIFRRGEVIEKYARDRGKEKPRFLLETLI